MLVKTEKVFNFKDYRSLEKIDFLSLSDFKCGIIIHSTLFIRLISHLRPYKKLQLSKGLVIDWHKLSTAQIESDKMRKKLKKVSALNNSLKHLGFLNLKKNSQFASNSLRVLCELNREHLESFHLKYTDNTLREESRIII